MKLTLVDFGFEVHIAVNSLRIYTQFATVLSIDENNIVT